MKEYEYSFKVKELKPYLKYCIKENYFKEKEEKQIRDLYSNNSGVLARVTTSKIKNKEIVTIDFKGEDNSNKVLKTTKESLPLIIDKKSLKAFYSILDILGYKMIKHLVRKRVVYVKGKVKFEIDKYISPEKMNVVAIEGKKIEVDKTYNEVNNTIK